jgi:hypothetical protein
MGLVKTELFSTRENETALLAEAIGHPDPVSILSHLFEIIRRVCGDIVNKISLAQPNVLQHLRELKQLGLNENVAETSTLYCIQTSNWTKMNAVKTKFLHQDEQHTIYNN